MEDHRKDIIGTCEDFIVPETDHAITAPLEPSGARRVPSIVFAMLTPIHLDDEPSLWAEEVNNVDPDRLLSPKPKSIELLSAYSRPQSNLRICRITPQAPRNIPP